MCPLRLLKSYTRGVDSMKNVPDVRRRPELDLSAARPKNIELNAHAIVLNAIVALCCHIVI